MNLYYPITIATEHWPPTASVRAHVEESEGGACLEG